MGRASIPTVPVNLFYLTGVVNSNPFNLLHRVHSESVCGSAIYLPIWSITPLHCATTINSPTAFPHHFQRQTPPKQSKASRTCRQPTTSTPFTTRPRHLESAPTPPHNATRRHPSNLFQISL